MKSWAVSESASKEFDRRKFFEMIRFVVEHGKANLEVHEGVGQFITECLELYKTGNYFRKDLEKLGLEKGISWEAERRVCDENGVCRVACTTKHVTDKMLEGGSI